MKTSAQRLIPACALLLALLSAHADTKQFTPDEWRKKLEADWVTDAEIRSAQGRAGSITKSADAAGGCDGIKDGKWGFHTGSESKPWWQVDLGKTQSVGRIKIWNRCDAADRAQKLIVLLSDNGTEWRKVYSHKGHIFFGFTDGKPLEIKLSKAAARFVRVQLPTVGYLHLDEVEVFGPTDLTKNLALHRPADQISTSQWSSQRSIKKIEPDWATRTGESLTACKELIKQLTTAGVNVAAQTKTLQQLISRIAATPKARVGRLLYFEARALERKFALANPLLDFDTVLFAERAPGSFSHMSDQYYGWWSRPGGGLYLLQNFKSDAPKLVCLTSKMPVGSFLRPELSCDGKKVIFAYCKFYPEVAEQKDKTDKLSLPEDAFYHVYEMNVDGSGLRQLTHHRYDDFDARYLPSGEIVFLSTRRGTLIQANKNCATRTLGNDALPDSFVRCGGDNHRPVSVYTLHVMDANCGNLRVISPFENFEWTPSIANDGRILYSRWDYVDRDNMPYMSLWSTNPDGTNPQLVYGNFTKGLHAVLEARAIPNSRKLLFTASAHHSISAGSLVLLDPLKGKEDSAPLQRITPEVCFPEVEGWPDTWYAGAYPLSEEVYLTGWSKLPLGRQGAINPTNGMGVYLYNIAGNRELLYRDDKISSMDPIPVRTRPTPPRIASRVDWDGPQDGRFLLLDVYSGLENVKRGEVKSLRVVAVPSKTQPHKNVPVLGLTKDDPGKCVLGTVPVEADGSAHFRVPSGVNVFFQALNAEGMAVQTMRTVTCVQPNQTASCIGCHESRDAVPQNHHPLAAIREPSSLLPGPEGSWPLRFDKLVQPVLDKQCVKCHDASRQDQIAAKFDLTSTNAYQQLVSFGTPSLKAYIDKRYWEGKSVPGEGVAKDSALLAYLKSDPQHQKIHLSQDDLSRLVTWMDTYAQRLGSYSDEQEHELEQFKQTMAYLLATHDK